MIILVVNAACTGEIIQSQTKAYRYIICLIYSQITTAFYIYAEEWWCSSSKLQDLWVSEWSQANSKKE